MKFAKVPLPESAAVIVMLKEMDVVDRFAKITKNGDHKLVPLLSDGISKAEKMGFEIVDGVAHSKERTPPQERILGVLCDIPKNVLDELPMRWEYVGDIAIIKLASSAEPYKKRIGQTYAENLGMKTICVDRGGVKGEFRRPDMETIYGKCTESIRLENGIRYCFDVTKVMFASGNIDERERMGKLDCTGEIIVDMFAGIGYFALPLAKFANASKVIACEKNPESYEFLVRNVVLNEVENIIVPVLGDNLDISGEAFADRIIMGYIQKTADFLPKALKMIKCGGTIHYHDTFYIHEYRDRVKEIFSKACADAGCEFRIEEIREVKSFAPSVSHYVVDVRID